MPEAVKKPGRFDKIYQDTQKYEGGFTVDHAGPTNYGITQGTYDAFRTKNKLSVQSVKNMPTDEARSIAEQEYFSGPKFDSFSDSLAEVLFDYGFHASPKRAAQSLQKVVGVKDDGVVGPKTIAATENYIKEHGEKALIKEVLGQREGHLKELIDKDPAKYKQYEKGWQNRINAIKDKFDISKLFVSDAEAAEIPEITSGRLDEVQAMSSVPNWEKLLSDQFEVTLEEGLNRISEGKTPQGNNVSDAFVKIVSAGMSVEEAEKLKGKTLAELKEMPGDIGRSVMFAMGLVATEIKKDSAWAGRFFNNPVSAVNEVFDRRAEPAEKAVDKNEEAFLRMAGRAYQPLERMMSGMRGVIGNAVTGENAEKVLQEGVRGFIRPEEMAMGYVAGKVAEKSVPQFGDLTKPQDVAFRNAMIGFSAITGTVSDMITLEIAFGSLGKRLSGWYKNQKMNLIKKDVDNFADHAAEYMVREGEKKGIFPQDWTYADKIGRSRAHVLSLFENNKAVGDFLLQRYTPSKVLFNGRIIIKDAMGQLKWAAENVPFKSNLKAFAYAKLPPKVYGIQAIQTLLNAGMAKEELEFSGVLDWLKGKEGKVDRDEIVSFIEQNKVKVEPVVKGDVLAKTFDDIKWSGNKDNLEGELDGRVFLIKKEIVGYYVAEKDGLLGRTTKNYTEAVETLNRYLKEQAPKTKYSRYTLPGGENYQETLLTLPSERTPITGYALWRHGTRVGADFKTKDEGIEFGKAMGWNPSTDFNVAPIGNELKQSSYKSSHWDEPNVLVHHRTNQRTDAQGNKGTFVEEIQSDWHREGRSKGYASKLEKSDIEVRWHEPVIPDGHDAKNYAGYWEAYDKKTGKLIIRNPGGKTAQEAIDATFRDWKSSAESGVPNAPFKNTWHELALKDIIRQAVERGDKFVAFISGQQTADRYDLSKQVDEIETARMTNGDFMLYARKKGENLTTKQVSKISELEEYIGKDPVKKLLEQEKQNPNADTYIIKGEDLRVGGEWAKKFYDDILPKTAEKYIKKWGGKVESISIPKLNQTSVEAIEYGAGLKPNEYPQMMQKGFYITPQMEKEVLELGQPLFGQRLAGGIEKLFEQRGTAGVEGEGEVLPNDSPERPKIFDEIKFEATDETPKDVTRETLTAEQAVAQGMSAEEWVKNIKLVGSGITPNTYDGIKYIEPLHEVRDVDKFKSLVNNMKKVGWTGRPVLAIETPSGLYAVTGSHRIAAAKEVGVMPEVYSIGFSKLSAMIEEMGFGNSINDFLSLDDSDKAMLLRNIDKDAYDLMRFEAKEGGFIREEDDFKTKSQLLSEYEAAKGAAESIDWDADVPSTPEQIKALSEEEKLALVESEKEATKYLLDSAKQLKKNIMGKVARSAGEEFDLIPKKVFAPDGTDPLKQVPLESLATENAQALSDLGYDPDGEGLRQFIYEYIGQGEYKSDVFAKQQKQIDSLGQKERDLIKSRSERLKQATKKYIETDRTLAKKIPSARVKTIIRELTGQTKDRTPEISENEALSRSLKRQEQVARKASIQTRRSTEELLGLLKKIKKPTIEPLGYEERKQIDDMKKEVRGIRSLPRDKRLPALRDLYARIEAVKEAGKAKYLETKEAKDALHEANKAVLLEIHNTESQADAPITFHERTKVSGSQVKKTVRALRANTLRPTRWLDIFDGGMDGKGPHNKFFYDRVDRAVDRELRNVDVRKDKFLAFLKEKNMTLLDLAKISEVDGIKLTADEMISIYTAYKNPDKTLAVIFGNNLPAETVAKVASTLDPKLKEIGDYIIGEYSSNWERLRRAFIEYTDGKHDLGQAEAYTPIRRLSQGYEPTDQEMAKEMVEREGLRQAYVERGFTKERQSIRPEFQSPIRLGEVGLWFEQVAKQEHFIELGSLVKEMQRMVNDPDFYKSVNANKRLGKEYYGVLQRWTNKVANPDIYKAFGDVEKLAQVMRGHAAIAYLSYNLITIMKQAPSVGLFMNEIGPVEIMGGLYQMTTDYANTKKFIHSLSSQMGNRAIERELEEFKRYNPNAYAQIVQRIGEVGMRGIYMMDEYITHSGWIASYNRSIREGLSEAEAAQIADKLVLTTQPAAHVKDLADIYTSNEFLNWFLQFSNQLNQIYNILTYDIPVKAKNGNYFDALRAAMGVGISFLMIHMINKGSVIPFKDEDEAKDFLAESTIATLPVVGPMINSGRKGFDPVSVPALSAVTGLIKSGDYFFKASAARGRKKKQYLGKGFEYGIESVATGLGLPYAQPRRTIKGILDLESGKTQDWRRVIWSSYSLGKDEQKRKRRHSSKR